MFVVSSQPEDLVLSGNPVLYKIRALDTEGMPFMWKGVRAELVTDGYVDIPVSEYFTISWQEPSGVVWGQSFEAAVSPSTPTQIPSDDSGYPTNLAYWEDIASIVQAHPAIFPLFTVYAQDNGDGISLWVVARAYEPGWEVSFSIANLTGPEFSTNSYNTPSTNAPDNYKVYIDVAIETTYAGGDYEVYATLEAIPDADSYATFDISEVLHKALQSLLADPPIPPWGTAAPYLLDTIRSYYIRIWEMADDEEYSDIEIFPSASTKLAMLGGIAQNLHANYNFFDNLADDNSLLTWYPDNKKVGIEHPEYITWFNYTASPKDIVLELIRYTTAGALNKLFRYDDTPLSVGANRAAVIPVGYTELAIDDEDVLKYTIRVVDDASDWEGGNPIYLSQMRTYYIDYAYRKEERVLMYLNSFYAPQALRCTGDLVEDMDVSRQESRHILPPNYSAAFAEIRQYEAEWSELFIYHTSWLSRLEARALQEMLAYNHLYEVSSYGYIPLYLLSESFPITATRNTLHNIELKTKPALLSKFYSNILIPLTPEQEAWLTDLEEYWQTALALPWETP